MIATWSYSKLSTWDRCPYQFRLRYLDEAAVEEVGAALLLGSAVHHAAGLLHSRRRLGRPIGTAELLTSFEDVLEASVEAAEAPVVFPKSHANLAALVDLGRRMVEAYASQVGDAPIVAVEQDVSCTGSGGFGVSMQGVVDRLERRSDGGLRVIELKTAARPLSQADVDLSDQPTVYAALLGDPSPEGVEIHYEIVTKAKRPTVIHRTTRRTARDIERLGEKIHQVSRAVDAGVFPRRNSALTCGYCPYRRRCQHGG